MPEQALLFQHKTCVVLPAFNAEHTLRKTVAGIPMKHVDHIFLVDDFSNDNTLQVAQELNLITHRHPQNMGYGANQKTCYRLALDHGADIIVMLHPDYQYDPKFIKYFVTYIEDGIYDVVLGSRISNYADAINGGMPRYKYFANRGLTIAQNILSRENLSEWHTGYRAYHRRVLEQIPFHTFSNDFVFDSQMLYAIVGNKYKIGEIRIPVIYQPESSSINFKRSLKYGLHTLWLGIVFLFKHLFSKKHARPA